MKFTKILANPPFGKIGVDITNIIMNEIPHEDIVILGTRTMLLKHCDKLALEYAYIENYVLNPFTKVKWVSQIIILGHPGKTLVSEQRTHRITEKGWEYPHEREFRIPFIRCTGGNLIISYKCSITRSRSSSLIIELTEDEWEKLKNRDNLNPYERFMFCIEIGGYRHLEIVSPLVKGQERKNN